MSEHAETVAPRRLFKPAPPHGRDLPPARCMCVECCRIIADLRCPVTDPEGHQCGDYKWHVPKKEHTLLICTVFQIAEERLRLDGSSDAEAT